MCGRATQCGARDTGDFLVFRTIFAQAPWHGRCRPRCRMAKNHSNSLSQLRPQLRGIARILPLVVGLFVASSVFAETKRGVSVGASYGTIGSDGNSGSLNAFVLRAGYKQPLGANWAFAVDYPVLGTVLDNRQGGDNQGSTLAGNPMFQLSKELPLTRKLSLTVGAGLTVGLARALFPSHHDESVAGFISNGDIYPIISGQMDRPGFVDRLGTVTAPLRLRYVADSGLFFNALASLDAGLKHDLSFDFRGTVEAGYRKNHLFGSVRGLAFQEVIRRLGKTQLGELDYAGGEARQVSLEAALGVEYSNFWIQGRGLYGRFSTPQVLTAFAGHLDVGVNF
jgi:hypothetical protein